MAFMSEISRMEVEPKRGKGLNDIIAIANGNKSWLRVESGDLALKFDFQTEPGQAGFVMPFVRAPGTRFCLVLIDGEYRDVSRAEVNAQLRQLMETL